MPNNKKSECCSALLIKQENDDFKSASPYWECSECGKKYEPSDIFNTMKTKSTKKQIKETKTEKYLRRSVELLEIIASNILPNKNEVKETENEFSITFPSITAKEIIDSCNNQVNGGKLLYNTDWYNNESFYTTEKTRLGVRYISKSLLHSNKTQPECLVLAQKKGKNLLNFAEVVYLLKESETFRNLLKYDNERGVWYTWSSSRSSDGRLVGVGDFGSGGAGVDGWELGGSDSNVGVCFSRSESGNND